MNFTLRELEAFLGVSRSGNFSRAARSLNMSQPALTVRIRHLEDALGVRLLDRTTRSVALTQIGREFLPVVERVLEEINAVALNARDLAERRRGLVTVAALPSIASALLPVAIAAFKASHPGITIRLRDCVAQRVTELVKSGEADFGIGSPAKRDPELRVSALVSDPIGAVFPPGHPLDRRGPIRLEDLSSIPLILMDSQYSVRALIAHAFESVGRPVVPAYEASYVPTALGLVKAGLGVAIIAFSAHETVQLSGLRARTIAHPMLVRHISLIESANRSLSPAAAAIRRGRLRGIPATAARPGPCAGSVRTRTGPTPTLGRGVARRGRGDNPAEGLCLRLQRFQRPIMRDCVTLTGPPDGLPPPEAAERCLRSQDRAPGRGRPPEPAPRRARGDRGGEGAARGSRAAPAGAAGPGPRRGMSYLLLQRPNTTPRAVDCPRCLAA